MGEGIPLVDPAKLADSPAHNSEAEDIMHQFARMASTTGEWPTIPLDGIEANKGLYTGGANRMDFLSPTHEGVIELLKSGLAVIRVVDGKKYLVLTDKFKAYYASISR